MKIYFASKYFVISNNVVEDNLALYVISKVCILIPRIWIADSEYCRINKIFELVVNIQNSEAFIEKNTGF